MRATTGKLSFDEIKLGDVVYIRFEDTTGFDTPLLVQFNKPCEIAAIGYIDLHNSKHIRLVSQVESSSPKRASGMIIIKSTIVDIKKIISKKKLIELVNKGLSKGKKVKK